jgi:hypothetical protein
MSCRWDFDGLRWEERKGKKGKIEDDGNGR